MKEPKMLDFFDRERQIMRWKEYLEAAQAYVIWYSKENDISPAASAAWMADVEISLNKTKKEYYAARRRASK